MFRYIVAYLLYLAGGCIIFESIEEAAESKLFKSKLFKAKLFKFKATKAIQSYLKLFKASRCHLNHFVIGKFAQKMCSGELKQQIAAKKVKFFILNKQGDVLLY